MMQLAGWSGALAIGLVAGHWQGAPLWVRVTGALALALCWYALCTRIFR